MSRIEVDFSKGQPRLLLSQKTKRKVLERTVKNQGPKYAKRHRERVRKVSRRYAKALSRSLGDALRPGGTAPTSISSGGVKRIPFKDGAGKSRRVNTSFWRPLSKNYVKRKPVSKQYWSKTGLLYRIYMANVSDKIRVNVRQGKGTGLVKVGGNKYVYRSVASLGMPQLPFAWTKIVAASFIQAKPFRLLTLVPGADRRGVGRVQYPEYKEHRPFISAMSAKMGQLLQARLRKLR